MDFNQVRYFLALADTLNFTRASEKCYVSQPALTQAIKRLETELGGELVHRDGRYTELTELGKSLRSHFEQIHRTQHLVQLTAKALTSRELTKLNIGIMCTIGPRMLGGLLDLFQMHHPTVSIVLHDVTPASIPELLLSGALDGAFCACQSLPHTQLRCMELFEEEMVVAFPAGHAFSEKDEVPLREVAQEHYVDRLHCEFRQEFMDFVNDQELALDVVFQSEREDWIQSLIRDGMGVSVMPRHSLLLPELGYRSIVEPRLSRQVGLAVVECDTVPPALGALIDQARHYDWPGSA